MLDNRSDANPGADPAILPALLSFPVLRDCSLSAWKALARWADGKTYGREDFWGGFCTAPFEGHHVSGGAFFLLFRWQYPAISAVCRLFTLLSIYKA